MKSVHRDIGPKKITTYEEALQCVQEDGDLYRHLTDEFKNRKEIILAAVSNKPLVIFHIPSVFKDDRDIVFAAAKQDGRILIGWNIPDHFKKDPEIVLAAVMSHGVALQYAHEDLQKDRIIVLAAVKQDGVAFQYVYHTLKIDRQIAYTAMINTNLHGGPPDSKSLIDGCLIVCMRRLK